MSFGSVALHEVGQVVGAHGLRGDIKVRVTGFAPEDLLAAKQVYLRRKDGEVEQLNLLRQSLHKGNVLLRMAGLESLTAVESLVGSTILLGDEDLSEQKDGRYLFHKLEGLQVVDQQLGPIGRLVSMFTTAAHDTYVVDGDSGEILIPAVPSFVTDIDLEVQIMKVDLPEGLISLNR
ncbi:MAG TPA: ribosome maturation factor RimM [Geopsychrobacteraceae bacterium]|nr:ribosome maturation factor RimM [Geopsychrobacteraceae bacterium]